MTSVIGYGGRASFLRGLASMRAYTMASFLIKGGRKLEGEVTVQGSKNAAGPIIAATLLSDKPCIVRNVPRVGDVSILLAIMKKMGSKQRWIDEHTIEIVNDEIDPDRVDNGLVCKIRLSILLIGPIVARFGRITIAPPGGCHLGARPITSHLDALSGSGARYEYDHQRSLYHIVLQEKSYSDVALNEFSVTATENMLMLHALNPQGARIQLAAAEPHVQDLVSFLEKLGVAVSGVGTHTLFVKGVEMVRQMADHALISDYLEAGTFLVAGILTRSPITIRGADPDHLTSVLYKLKEFGVDIERVSGALRATPVRRLAAARIQTMPYPGFPTDLQAPFGVLATQAEGTTLIFDTLFENRLQYIGELVKMGANAAVVDPHRALITGPTPLFGIDIRSFDIRSGATLVLAALIAQGESVIHEAEQIERGYEGFDEKLRALGADIRRVEN